jgi:hypothetical protein
MLRKELTDGHHDDWEDVFGEVCFAYRSSIQSSTNESPYLYSPAWKFLEQDKKNNQFQIILAESIPVFSPFLLFFFLFSPSITLPLFFV